METQKNAINWFEIPVVDFERAKRFYETVLDFTMHAEQMGPYMMGFLPSQQEPDSVGGAIVAGEGYVSSGYNGPKVYLNGGDDLQNALSRIERAGGQITMPKTQITPEYGYMAFFQDTEGNVVGLHSNG